MRTLVFEDNGQDFLEWDIDDKGVVVASRPFQNSVWKGTIVTRIRKGRHPRIKTRHIGEGTLIHKVIEIRKAAA